MKLATVLFSAVLASASFDFSAAQACEKVSVVGDATYCIKGPVCSGTGSSPGGTACPQVGDTAVEGCQPYFPAYNKTTGKCTAPVPADCKPTASGAWGCIWDLSKLPGAPGPAPTPAPSSVPGPAPAPGTGDCQKVSVVGDGTYCIKGPVCSGTGATPGGTTCPQVGDTAVSNCFPYHPSYNKATGKCTAPVPADCKPTGSGAWGCIWDLSKLPAPASTPGPSPAPVPAPAPAPGPSKSCQEVSVVGDGTFCINGPVCSGTPNSKGGDQCPKVGDTAIAGCNPYNPSFDKATGKCIAPVPADCKPTNGVWACVWDLSKLPKRE